MHCLEVIIKRNRAAAPVYDFVFIERDGGSPYRVRHQNGKYWLCRLHPDKQWIWHRELSELNEAEMEMFAKHAIKQEYAHMYEFGVPFEDAWPVHQRQGECEVST